MKQREGVGGEEGGGKSEGEQERAKGGIQTDRQAETEAYTWPNVSEMQKGHQVVSNLRREADLAKGLFAGTWHRGALTWHVFGLMGLILGSTNSPSPPTMPIHGRLQNQRAPDSTAPSTISQHPLPKHICSASHF